MPVYLILFMKNIIYHFAFPFFFFFFSVNNYCWKSTQSTEKLVLPIAGFKTEFKLYNIPDDADLKSVQALRSRQVKDEGKRRKLLRYTGEVNCVCINNFSDFISCMTLQFNDLVCFYSTR